VSRLILLVVGFSYVLSGVAMLAQPMWFFDHIGTFPPFNRHYVGDLGSFILPIGLALMWSARDARYARGAVLVALGASTLHLLNHVYDAAVGTVPDRGWSDVPGLAVVLVLLIVPLWRLPTTSIRTHTTLSGRHPSTPA